MAVISFKSQQDREKEENEFTDDMLLQAPTFVTMSKMTTDEAIVIKNGILRRIMEKYGNDFTTSSTVLIKDNITIQRDKAYADSLARDYAFWAIIVLIGLIIFATILKWLGVIRD